MNREAVLKVAGELRTAAECASDDWARFLNRRIDELEAACAIPKDWQLVPVEPTQAMLDAGFNEFIRLYDFRHQKDAIRWREAIKTALAAAPKVKP